MGDPWDTNTQKKGKFKKKTETEVQETRSPTDNDTMEAKESKHLKDSEVSSLRHNQLS